MHFFQALATDYDGTIAHDGVVDEATVEALKRLKQAGRRLILVTGRELPDLKRVCPEIELFDRIVAENGAVLSIPPRRRRSVRSGRPRRTPSWRISRPPASSPSPWAA